MENKEKEVSCISIKDVTILSKKNLNQFDDANSYITGKFSVRKALQSLLTQNNWVGERIYYGIKSCVRLSMHIVVVDGDDTTIVELLEFGLLCPNPSLNANELNS